MWIMSLMGPHTTPFDPAYAQPRIVITPGFDLMFDFTPQSGLPSLNVPKCLARLLAVVSGYTSKTSAMSALFLALISSVLSPVSRLMAFLFSRAAHWAVPALSKDVTERPVGDYVKRERARQQPVLQRFSRRGSRPLAQGCRAP